jgi:hypothetical protein
MKTKLFIFGIPTLIIWFVLSTIVYAKIGDSSNKIDGQSPEGIACSYIKLTYSTGFDAYYKQDKGLALYNLGSLYIDATDEKIKNVLTSIYEYKLGLNRIPSTSGINYDFVEANIRFDLDNSYKALKRACISKYGLANINGIN